MIEHGLSYRVVAIHKPTVHVVKPHLMTCELYFRHRPYIYSWSLTAPLFLTSVSVKINVAVVSLVEEYAYAKRYAHADWRTNVYNNYFYFPLLLVMPPVLCPDRLCAAGVLSLVLESTRYLFVDIELK